MKVETLIKNSCKSVGEGPHWDNSNGVLLYVDIYENCVHRWNPATAQDETKIFEKSVSFVIPRKSGGYVIGLGQTVAHFDWDNDAVTVLHTVDEGKSTRFNDGKCDAVGRLWCGTMAFKGTTTLKAPKVLIEEGVGSLYCVDLDGSIKKAKEGLTLSNGLTWTADNKTMYLIDSTPRRVYKFDYDINTGSLNNESIFIDFNDRPEFDKKIFPDGMTIDTGDRLWIACFLGGKVIQFDPNTAQVLSSIEIPVLRTTSCCFGGNLYNEMFITCSRYLLPEQEEKETPLAGSVFKVTGLEVKGRPATIFQG